MVGLTEARDKWLRSMPRKNIFKEKGEGNWD